MVLTPVGSGAFDVPLAAGWLVLYLLVLRWWIRRDV